MIICPDCSKENQDHYKFCLGCGAELPKNAPKQFTAELQQSPAPEPQAKPAPQQPAKAEPAKAEPAKAPACPQCSHPNDAGNRFCAACGYKLSAQAVDVAQAPVAQAPVAPAPIQQSDVYLTALRADGTEAGTYRLPSESPVVIGRDTGTIFAGDSYLSPQHAQFHLGTKSVKVSDLESLNGIYVKLPHNTPHRLEDGDVFRIGQEIIRFEALQPSVSVNGVAKLGSPTNDIVGRIALVIGRQTTGNAFPVPQKGLHLGRERGDVLFSDDGYVSGLHCQVTPAGNHGVYITDLGSSNGTFVRVRKEHELSPEDILLMGQQVFRIDF